VPDLSNAKKNWNKEPGYTEAETTSFKNVLDPPKGVDAGKFVDVWRHFHPNDKHYTYFSYRFNCRLKGLGWRLDMCKFVSFRLVKLSFMTFYSRLERTPTRMCKDGRRTLLTWMITFFVNPIISSVKLEMRFMGLQIIVQSSWRWTENFTDHDSPLQPHSDST